MIKYMTGGVLVINQIFIKCNANLVSVIKIKSYYCYIHFLIYVIQYLCYVLIFVFLFSWLLSAIYPVLLVNI